MPLGTLDRTPPPFFKQGPSALSKLIVYAALALFLMVLDARFKVTQPLRATVATALYPAQWLAMRPVRMLQGGAGYFDSLQKSQTSEAQAHEKLAQQSQRAALVEQLAMENARLRKLLALSEQIKTEATAAIVLYDAADPFTRKVIIDKGLTQGIGIGSPVLDEFGVLGQVTRVHPLVSEVTLLVDRDQAIPVLNNRTGARSVAYGDPWAHGGVLELRFMAGNADVQPGDLLTTSGVDGIYPAGLPVAKVDKVERRAESSFAKIYCNPQAAMTAAKYVMVRAPVSAKIPPKPPEESAQAATKKGAKK
jgi:rod shape-determining protein MreC